MLLLTAGLNTEAGGGKKVTLQYKFTGAIEDSCYFTLEDGKVDASTGTLGAPDLTIETPFDLWMDIMTGKADGQQMFLEEKYKVSGDISLMIQLFQRESAPE